MPTKPDIPPTKLHAPREKMNDIGFRVILIPALGIVIPLLTGMVNNRNFSNWEIKGSFLYTILISFVIWEGNRYLLFTLRSYFNWFNKPLRKMLALILAVSFYTIPVSTLMLIGWFHLFGIATIDWELILTTSLVIMICVVFIVHVYETVFLVRETENEMLRSEQLERARAEAELEALKNQIDPHFIFNSLNTLSHLIEEKPLKARIFNDNLAEVYRYILQNKKKELVFLREELAFIRDYFTLLAIRFEQAVELRLELKEELAGQVLIPPLALQLLVENAIKHNEFSDSRPLLIRIGEEGESLFVENPNRKRSWRKAGSKIGLDNLKERYKLITGKNVLVEETMDHFRVKLPLLKIG